jgi:hypothetical protein
VAAEAEEAPCITRQQSLKYWSLNKLHVLLHTHTHTHTHSVPVFLSSYFDLSNELCLVQEKIIEIHESGTSVLWTCIKY